MKTRRLSFLALWFCALLTLKGVLADDEPHSRSIKTSVQDGWVTVLLPEFPDAINNPLKGFRDYKPDGYGLLKHQYIKWNEIEGEVEYNWQKQRESAKPAETFGRTPDETMTVPAYRRYMIDKIRRYHASYLGWISGYNASNREVLAGAAELQKAFGYRFVLDSVSYPLSVWPGKSMTVKLTVRNTGSGLEKLSLTDGPGGSRAIRVTGDFGEGSNLSYNFGNAAKLLSAAQPQPNAHVVTIVLVAGIPLCRAALNGATSSPMGKMRLRSMAEQLEDKSLEPHANLRFPLRLYDQYSKGCTVVAMKVACGWPSTSTGCMWSATPV